MTILINEKTFTVNSIGKGRVSVELNNCQVGIGNGCRLSVQRSDFVTKCAGEYTDEEVAQALDAYKIANIAEKVAMEQRAEMITDKQIRYLESLYFSNNEALAKIAGVGGIDKLNALTKKEASLLLDSILTD